MGRRELTDMAEKVITIADSITVGELAEKLNLPVTNLIGELFKNGIVSSLKELFTSVTSFNNRLVIPTKFRKSNN